MNNWSPDIFAKAWNFATLAHHGQRYGGPETDVYIDYNNHIASVAMEAIWALQRSPACNADLVIQCALLHDVIEDTPHTQEDIKARFGEDVADGVMALSKDLTLPKERQLEDSLIRIQHQPREVWMVKLADRITNLYHPPFYWNLDKKKAYREEAKSIYDALCTGNAALASRLMEKINLYERFF